MMDDDWERLSQSSSPGAASDTSSVGSSTDHSVGLGPAPGRRSSFSYHRLPDPRLRLSVLKLDNTSFEVKIAMTATVSELRNAVEGVFRDHSEDDGGVISWTHVWGHFCLCYEDYKLVDDRACIKDYGIKDGDQLRFIRHLSVTTPTKTEATQPTDHEAIVELNVLRLTGPEDPTELEEVNHNNNSNDNSPVSPDEGSLFFHRNQKRTEEIVAARAEFRLVHWLRTWISHTKLASPRKSPRTPSPRTPKAGKYIERVVLDCIV